MRPLGVGEVLDASIKLVRRHFKALAIVTLIIAVPIAILSGLVTALTTDFCRGDECIGGEFEADTVFVYEDDFAYYGGQTLNAALSVLQFVVVQIACFRILAEGYLGRSVGWAESVRYALSRGWSTLWLTVLLLVGLLFAFICLIVPGIWLAIAWSVAIPVLLVEDLRGPAALRRSFELVKGLWWPTAGKILVSTLLIFVAAGAIGAAFAVLLLFVIDEASYAGLIVTGVGNVLGNVITTPFLAAVTTLVYFDLRVRREGFDLAMLAERMGGAPATGALVAAPPPSPWNTGETPAPAAGGWAPPAERPATSWGPPSEPREDPWKPPSFEKPSGSVREEEPLEPLPEPEPLSPPPEDDGLGGFAPPGPGGSREP